MEFVIYLIYNFFGIILGWDLELGFIITFILFLATAICCDKSKKISFKIYLYLAILLVLGGAFWILVLTILNSLEVFRSISLVTFVFSVTLLYLMICLIGVIYILKKYFSCKKFIPYFLFIMFIFSLARYTFIVTFTIFDTLISF